MAEGPDSLDPELLERLSEAGLAAATAGGASYAEVRVESIRSQYLSLRDAALERSGDDRELGVSVRVLSGGSLGFAASAELEAGTVAALAGEALAAARLTAAARPHPVELAPEAGHGRCEWSSQYRIEPASVPLAEKVERFTDWSRTLLAAPGIDHATAHLLEVTEDKYFASTLGTTTTQRRVRVQPSLEALALAEDGSGFETMRTLAAPAGRGYEYVLGEGADLDAEVAALPELLAEKLAAPSVEAGTYDLVIDPTNLWLTIHESVGHATELDRALGYEAAYAGTSFVTFDRLGELTYGSPLMNVTGDRTAAHGLATVGFDDDGVEAQSFDIVSEGRFVGYQLDREFAAKGGFARSNGCSYASSPLMVPMQRMANVSLAPAAGEGPDLGGLLSGVERGIYIVGDKSWSIDMQRYNFQFTGQRFYRIEGGRLAGQLRDVAYQATTTEFWGSLAALGGRSTYRLGGAMNCGKGQPGQSAPVSHGCPAALFSGVRVLNTRDEAGR
ncbi:MAG TPA: TldD/PmbA family protein [Acidimicrobiales bacterium]|nr:TldD/PmbA family protein [Acidimicrobiales bacterium]